MTPTYSTVILCPTGAPEHAVVIGHGPDGTIAHAAPGAP